MTSLDTGRLRPETTSLVLGVFATGVISAVVARRRQDYLLSQCPALRACPHGREALRTYRHLQRCRDHFSAYHGGVVGVVEEMGERQVGGHKRGGSTPSERGMLLLGPCYLLKPMQAKERGSREARFYEEIECLREQGRLGHLHGLDAFLSPYHGCLAMRRGVPTLSPPDNLIAASPDGTVAPSSGDSPADEDSYECLVLTDLTAGMSKPCVLDVKLGRRTFEPGCSHAKAAKELAKYPLQHEAGFRFIGSRVFTRHPNQSSDASDGTTHDGRFVVVGKAAYQAVGPEGALAVLRSFVAGSGAPLAEPLAELRGHERGTPKEATRVVARGRAKALAARVGALALSVASQRAFTFTSASALLVYDAVNDAHADLDDHGGGLSGGVEVRLIDLAHVRCAGGVEFDESTAFGLTRLAKLLDEVALEKVADE